MSTTATAPHRLSAPKLAATAAIGLAVAATLTLWAYYGTAIFYETILTGLIACL